MADVVMLDKRSPCRVCGSKSHVCTVANARSPRLGLCASCGMAAGHLADWYKHHGDIVLLRLVDVVVKASDAHQPVRKPLERAV